MSVQASTNADKILEPSYESGQVKASTESKQPDIKSPIDPEIKEANNKALNSATEIVKEANNKALNSATEIVKGDKVLDTIFDKVIPSLDISMHTLAIICQKMPVVGKIFDKSSIATSKFLLPLNYIRNGYEAIKGNRILEGLIRFSYPLMMFRLPFYNLNHGSGLHSGLNMMHDIALEEIGSLENKDPNKVEFKNAKDYFSKIKAGTKSYLKRLTTGKLTKEQTAELISGIGMAAGGAAGVIAAPDERDTSKAKLFGNTRNVSGGVGDLAFVFKKKSDGTPHRARQITGISCGLASLLNIAQRWVGDGLANTLVHASTALDNFGLMVWSNDSSKRNKEILDNQASNAIPDPEAKQSLKAP